MTTPPSSFTSLTSLTIFYFGDNAGLCAPTDSAFRAWLQGIEEVGGSSCDFAPDRAVLVRLYNATDGANWQDSYNWLSELPMREWYGVDTDDEGRVVELHLAENQLSGTIPNELGSLSNLTGLWLWDSQLTGTIPSELGNLPNLQWLILGGNQLTGTIPSELGNLPNLTELGLWGNQLTGTIPSELGDLTNLTVLNLSGNQLTGTIPTELGDLSNLTGLLLWGNQLSGDIPSELGDLTNARHLSLDGNQLIGEIPTELGSLANLEVLDLSTNKLSGEVPSSLGDLSNLIYLWLDQNELRGAIPNSLTGLTLLERLTFFSNAGLCAPVDSAFQAWLQGIDSVHGSSCAPVDSQEDRAVLADLYSATDGANWEDNSNWLSNRPVREWYGVANDANGRVTGLYLWDNQLTGSIPLQLGNLSNLETLFLSDNQLTGCIPEGLQDVEFNDFDQVGLPFCEPQSPGAPTVSTATAGIPMVRTNSPIPVTATFSEPVNGFTVDDVSVANGSAGNFDGGDGDSVYTFDVTPNAIGVVTVDIAAGVAEDSDGNGNTAAVHLKLGLPYDDDHDGAISGSEVLEAVRDYFAGRLTGQQVLAVVRLYFQ